jgi:chorismate mutase
MLSRISTALVFACLVAACATSPTGRKQLMIVSESQAIVSSRQAYVQEMGKYKKEGKLVTDPKVLNRVKVITERLVAQVLGHEIAHALANHTAERMSVAMASQMGVLAAGILLDQSATTIAAGAAAAQVAVNLPNSRTAETEADRIGIELAARAGYDPHAAVTLWQKMAAVSGGKGPPQFLSTHPSDAQRQQALAKLVPQMMPYYKASPPWPSYPVRVGAAAV